MIQQTIEDYIILGFNNEPEKIDKEFTKDEIWDYWIDDKDNELKSVNMPAKEMIKKGYIPITEEWFNGEITSIRLGSLANDEVINIINNMYSDVQPMEVIINYHDEYHVARKIKDNWYIHIGDCTEMSVDERSYITEKQNFLIGKSIKIEVITDSTTKSIKYKFLQLN